LRLQRQGAVETRQRLVVALQSSEDDAAIVQRFDQTRIHRQHAVIGRQRLGRAVRRHQRCGVKRHQARVTRVQRQRGAHQARGFAIAALLPMQKSQKLQGGKIAPVATQDFAAQTLGLRQVAPGMKRRRLFV
jgi:hypothetical protein